MVHDKVKEGHIERFHSDKNRKEKDIQKNNIRFLEKLQSVRSDYIFEKILKKAKRYDKAKELRKGGKVKILVDHKQEDAVNFKQSFSRFHD